LVSVARRYAYVGPERLRVASRTEPRGTPIPTNAALRSFLAANPDARTFGVTFTVDLDGTLRLAPRRSEHVACAGAEDVLAAGELRMTEDRVLSVTNQSTGYCPEPECWPAVAAALARAGLRAPTTWTTAFVFRRCSCGQINVVKDDWFVCAVCDAALPMEWNFEAP
jgi:hypothetical protein